MFNWQEIEAFIKQAYAQDAGKHMMSVFVRSEEPTVERLRKALCYIIDTYNHGHMDSENYQASYWTLMRAAYEVNRAAYQNKLEMCVQEKLIDA